MTPSAGTSEQMGFIYRRKADKARREGNESKWQEYSRKADESFTKAGK